MSKIDVFRREYDPYVDLIEPHLTFVFPVPNSIGRDALIDHISSQLKSERPFEVRIGGLEKAWDHWLFLILDKGNNSVKALHDELYKGVLAPCLRTDIEFIPHIGIGLFVKDRYEICDPKAVEFDQETYDIAVEKAKVLNQGQTFLIDNLTLIEIDDGFENIKLLKEFYF